MLVRCTHCKQQMQYEPKGDIPLRKRCVYCGRSFVARQTAPDRKEMPLRFKEYG